MERMNIDTAIDILLEHEQICSVCRYDDGCHKGVHGGPDGPIYPVCCDVDYKSLIHHDDAIDLAEEIANDV